MFVLGVDPVSWSAVKEQTVDEYEKLVRDGGRLIFAFLPVDAAQQSLDPHRPIEERWGLKTSYRKTDSGALSFEIEASHDWTKLEHGAIERKFGKGTIVLVPESLPLSNQGLRDERDAEFIAALAGLGNHILFDENHFGVVETGSVAKLMRKYHLEGAMAVLAMVAGLFLVAERVESSSASPDARAIGRGGGRGTNSLRACRAAASRHRRKGSGQRLFRGMGRSRRKHDERAARVEAEIREHRREGPGGGVSRGVEDSNGETMTERLEQLHRRFRRGAHRSLQSDPGTGRGDRSRADRDSDPAARADRRRAGRRQNAAGADAGARARAVEFARIQFTPDLMPADITGTNVFQFRAQRIHAGARAGVHVVPAGR